MSDTPETDKAERMAFAGEYMVPTEFARELERQRDEARAWAEKLQTVAMQHSIRDENAERERDEAFAECKALWSLVNANKQRAYKAERERDEAREALSAAKHSLTKERDEALEALEYIAHSGMTARHIEDYAKEFLKRKEAAK